MKLHPSNRDWKAPWWGRADGRVPAIHVVCGCLVAVWGSCLGPAVAGRGQEPSREVGGLEVEQITSESAVHLEHARQLLAQGQGTDAVEALLRGVQEEPTRLVPTEMALAVPGFKRLVPLALYGQHQLASWVWEAPEALAHYRSVSDGLAETWYREGVARQDRAMLKQVVRRAFASRWADDALLALGDLALLRGDLDGAREAWQAISPGFRVSAQAAAALGVAPGCPWWVVLRGFDAGAWPPALTPLLRSAFQPQALPGLPAGTYPDSDLDLAAVAARLTLASLLKREEVRSRTEQALLAHWFPGAEGEMGGRRGRWTDLLDELREASHHWQPPRQDPDWPALGGDAARGKVLRADRDGQASLTPRWSHPWPRLVAPREMLGQQQVRVAEDRGALLSYFPIVVGRQVLVQEPREDGTAVVALDLATGRVQWEWRVPGGAVLSGEKVERSSAGPRGRSLDVHRELTRHRGVARYVLESDGRRLFFRSGSPVTVPTSRRAGLWLTSEQGRWEGLDLQAEGRQLEGFPFVPPSREWTLEAIPLSDGHRLYGVLRRLEGGRCQLFVAAWDLPTAPRTATGWDTSQPAPPVWQTRIGTTAPGGGEIDQLTHLLLTLQAGRLFLNTQAGAVAALDAEDGQLLWLVRYPRAELETPHPDRPQRHRFRDVTPCLAAGEWVIAAPADCDRLFAIAAASGELAWTTPPGVADDVVHLLGVEEDLLLASGDRLYWIDAPTGRILTSFPPGALGGVEQAAIFPRGMGRGLIAGKRVYWPTREAIYVFSVQPAATPVGPQPHLVERIELGRYGGTGGHLLSAEGWLLVATGEQLVAYGPQPPATPAEQESGACGQDDGDRGEGVQ